MDGYVFTSQAREITRRGYLLCFVISAAFLVVTGLVEYGGWTEGLRPVLGRFNLGSENNVAVWWSGMLLAFLSLQAFDGYVAHRGRSPRLSGAWATVAAVLAFLSLDEIGSLHERLGIWGEAIGIGQWGLVLPLGAVLGIPLARALLFFWQADERRTALLLALGMAVLGSVAIQEYLSQKYLWPDGLIESLRQMVEEGSELAGMLMLMWVMRDNTGAFARQPARSGLPTLAAVAGWWRPLLIAAALLAPLLTVLTAELIVFDNRGRPSDWLAATLLMLAGITVLRSAWAHDRPRPGEWITAGLLLLASIAVLVVPPTSLLEVLGVSLGTRLALVAVLGLALAGIGALASRRRGIDPWLFAPIAMLSAATPFLPAAPISALLWSQIFALVSFVAICHAGETQSAARARGSVLAE